jgi:molecular chaperone GrpE
MTSARKADEPKPEDRPSAESAEGRVEGAERGPDPRDVPTGAKVAHSATNAPIEPENESAEGVDADLDALLADVQRERDEYLDLARRAKADFENYRKRAARDVAEAEGRGKAAIARELVPVVDNLERALRAAGVDPAGEPEEPLARGVALVYRELQETLGRAGVEPYDPLGERFDPTWHEALSTQPADGTESGIVLETLERGYRLNGQVLRPARVVVSQ